MRAPRRLKDDPDFLAEHGNVLQEEELAVGNYDLDGLRARVVGGAPVPSSGSSSGPSWWKIAAVSGFTASVVTFVILQLQAAAPVVAPTHTPDIEVLEVGPVEAAPRDAGDGAAVLEPVDAVDASPADLFEKPVPVTLSDLEPDLAPDVPVDAVASDPPAPVDPPAGEADADPPSDPIDADPKPAGTGSALVAELADYNRAVELNDDRRWMDAHAAWGAYLEAWPNGRLRSEARLGQLTALINAGRPADVERLAGELLATPDLGAQRDDLRLLRAEALVELNRCTEAVTLLEGMKRTARIGAVRSTCRKAGRGQ